MTLPKQLVEGREQIEGNFIFCLWKDPQFFEDYAKTIKADETFLFPESILYYTIGKNMFDLGFNSFDAASVSLFLSDKESTRDSFEALGGFRTVEDITSVLSIDGLDAYYEELVRSNVLIDLHKSNFNVLSELDRLKLMTTEQIYDYYDRTLNKIMINKTTNLNIESLSLTDSFFEKLESVYQVGLQYGKYCPILNYQTLGVHKGDLYMLGSFSGIGKTSKLFHSYIMPIVENGHKTCIISNEQQIEAFQALLTIYVLTNEFEYYNVTRKKLSMWNLTPEEQEMVKVKARAKVDELYKDRIKFVRMYDYDNAKIKRVVRQLSKEGYELFVYDTMKAEDLTDGQFWQSLVEASKDLFQLAASENVAIITSYQLAISQQGRRWLDASCLSNAKQIKEVYSEMIYMRNLWQDEYTGEKNDVKPYQFIKGSDGKYTNSKKEIKLDPDKKYIVAFVDKTRNGEKGTCILYEFRGEYNRWKEIGFCTVKQDRGVF